MQIQSAWQIWQLSTAFLSAITIHTVFTISSWFRHVTFALQVCCIAIKHEHPVVNIYSQIFFWLHYTQAKLSTIIFTNLRLTAKQVRSIQMGGHEHLQPLIDIQCYLLIVCCNRWTLNKKSQIISGHCKSIKSTGKTNMTKLTTYGKEMWSSPILSPSMDSLNHLREQGADTLVDQSLEEVYSLLVVQIKPEFLLKLMNAHHTRVNK